MIPAQVTVYDCSACGRPVFLAAGSFHHFRHHPQDHDVVVLVVVITRDAS
jgi:hypothetical protein